MLNRSKVFAKVRAPSYWTYSNLVSHQILSNVSTYGAQLQTANDPSQTIKQMAWCSCVTRNSQLFHQAKHHRLI